MQCCVLYYCFSEQRIKKTNFTSNCHFAVLLSPDFIQSNFGPNTYQVRSGESIVSNTKINDQFVYKCPLKKLDLQKLCQLFTQPPPSIESCALPIDSIFITDCFFKFNLYISPLPKSVAKFSFRWFFVVLLEAINALHDVGIAHLDVRLENICYKEDGMVVLIDLDRSLPTDCPAITLSSYYGNSLMYRPGNDDWTCKQQDMRQLAILIGDIAGNDDYHTIPPNEEVLHIMYVHKLYNDD